MSAHKNSAELFELLLKYKSKHGTYSGISDSPGQSDTCNNQNNSFRHVSLEIRLMEIISKEGVVRSGYQNDQRNAGRNFRNSRTNCNYCRSDSDNFKWNIGKSENDL